MNNIEKPPKDFKNEIYEMDLHDVLHVSGIKIVRVAGGWLYDASFVPMNNEFKQKPVKNEAVDVIDYNAFIVTWNKFAEDCFIPKITALSDNRKKKLRDIVKTHGKAALLKAMKIASTSSFLNGKSVSDRSWVMGLDFFLKPDNFLKILEVSYGGNENSKKEWVAVSSKAIM
jgi:hypothetical protein